MQAQSSLSESSQRLDLIRHSLELRNKELPPQQSAKAAELKRELDTYTGSGSVTTGGSTYRADRRDVGSGGPDARSSALGAYPLGKSAAITGKLEVRLMGCQDLLEDVPGRSRRDSTHSAPNDLKSFVKGDARRIPRVPPPRPVARLGDSFADPEWRSRVEANADKFARLARGVMTGSSSTIRCTI